MPQKLRQKLVDWTIVVGEKILMPIERWLGRMSLVGDKTFHSVDEFPWAHRLEADWEQTESGRRAAKKAEKQEAKAASYSGR